MLNFTKSLKKLKKKFSDENTPSLVHTFDNTLSLYARGKDAKPLVSVSASGDIRVSLVTLAALIFGVAAIASATTLLIARAAERVRKRKRRKYCGDCEELPF